MKKLFWLLILLFSFAFISGCSLFPNEEETDYSNDERHKIYLLAQSSGFSGTYEEWLASIAGDQIELTVTSDNKFMWKYRSESADKYRLLLDLSMLKGEKGNGIASIVRTDRDGLVDIYTITFTDGSTTTFNVTNGASSGEAAISIKTTYVDDNGDLIVVYTNDTKQNAGHVTHKYHYETNEEGHWLECSCGEKIGFEKHDFVRKSLTENNDGTGILTYACSCGLERYETVNTDPNQRTPEQDKADLEKEKFRVFIYSYEGSTQVLADNDDHKIAIFYGPTEEIVEQFANEMLEGFLSQARFEEQDGVYVCLSGWKVTGKRIVFSTYAEDMDLIEYWNNIPSREVYSFKTDWAYNKDQHYHPEVSGKDIYYGAESHQFEAGSWQSTGTSGVVTYTCKVCGYSYQEEYNNERTDGQTYHAVGGFGWWRATDNNKMENCSLTELQLIDSNLVNLLANRDVKYLYSTVIEVGSDTAGWTTNFLENETIYSIDGCYTIKVLLAEKIDDETYDNVQWIPDPNKAHVEALTNNLFIPAWQEENDEYGFNWANNPVITSGAGRYLVVVADYGKDSDVSQYGYGIGVIKISDIPEDSSVLDKIEKEVTFSVLVNNSPVSFDDINTNPDNALAVRFTLKKNHNVMIIANGKALDFTDNKGVQTGSYIADGYGYYTFFVSRSLDVWVNVEYADEPAPIYKLYVNDNLESNGYASEFPNVSRFLTAYLEVYDTVRITYDDVALLLNFDGTSNYNYLAGATGEYEFIVIGDEVYINDPVDLHRNDLTVKVNGVVMDNLVDVNDNSAQNKAAYKLSLNENDVVMIYNGRYLLTFYEWKNNASHDLGQEFSVTTAGDYTFWINNSYEIYISK